MNVPTVTLDDIVEELRDASNASMGHAPTVAQVTTLVNDIWNMEPIEVTANRPSMAGLSQEDLISIAELFGKHRARALKRGLVGRRVRYDHLATGMLLAPSEKDIRAARELIEQGIVPKRTRWNKAWRREVDPNGFPKRLYHVANLALLDWGVVPEGYDRDAGHGRDVHQSLSALLAQPVTEAEIIRFVDRTYSGPAMTLEADHVRMLHWLASNGLSHKLLELVGKKAVITENGVEFDATGGQVFAALARTMATAYDLLEVARADAVRALASVVRGAVTDPAQVRSALVSASWLSPGPIGRVIQAADRTLSDPSNDRAARIFASTVASFCTSVRSRPNDFVVRSVDRMTAAHVIQVLALSGLNVDDGEEKAAMAELRTRLVEMGLRNDLDRELPEAMRAWRSGRLEEYFTSRQARLDGDPEWARLYKSEDAAASST